MNIREQVFYGRQSVDKKDSISIESQFEFCQYELRGEQCRKFTDKGYSGKNMDRPQFQAMIREIEQGLISKVIVYKLDRISRSIIDFAGMMALFAKYNVEFVSATEKFDTSTPMGRAMLNICIVFAQLERETIVRRVTDAFYSRCQKGFHMSGKAPYGYRLVPTVINDIRTKMLEPDPETAERAKLMFEMYAQPQTSYGDIARYFSGNGDDNGREFSRVTLSQMLRNPVYAQADLDLYEFFKAQGAVIVNDPADFTGINGCYIYKGRESTENKKTVLQDQILVIAPHEGLVPSDVWLTVRKKLMGNTPVCGPNKKAKNTWLAGKIKCGKCGAALMCKISPNGDYQYFRCRKRIDTKTCEGCGTLRVREVEASVYGQICRKMAEFKTVTGRKTKRSNPKLTALNIELAQVETAIEKLLDTLMEANKNLVGYVNGRIDELDEKRQTLTKAIADMSASAVSTEQIIQISSYLDNWDNTEFEERRLVADGLISSIQATRESISIKWKI